MSMSAAAVRTVTFTASPRICSSVIIGTGNQPDEEGHIPRSPGMAQRVIRQLVDDLDGSVIPPGTGERLRFALRGREYWLDLSEANVERLDKALQPFIDAAVAVVKDRRHNRGASVQQPPGLGKRAAVIRAWARDHGYDVPIRGRISGEIITAFEAAQPDGPA
jgi:hypothetical protein